MTAPERTVVVGVFTDRQTAEQAMGDLRQAGFSDDHIGFVVRESEVTQPLPATGEVKSETGATTGAVTGGVIGGLVGAAAALLIPGFGPAIAGGILTTLGGAAIGAATGSLIAAFVNMGVSEADAQYYERELHAGRTVVIVQPDGRQEEAFRILRRTQAYNADTPPGEAGQQPSAAETPQTYNTNPLPVVNEPKASEEVQEPGTSQNG